MDSRNLEVISDGSTSAEKNNERRRLPRLNLSAEQFRLEQTGKIFSVTDLSTEGMAIRILDRDDLILFPVASELKGTLRLHGEKHEVNARVRHIGPESIGCQFEALLETTRAALTRFLDPAILGAEMKPIPSSEAGTVWYHGPSGTDLLLKRGNDGQFHRMTLYVLGSYIQWTSDAGLSTGRAQLADEHLETRGILRIETLWLIADSSPETGKLTVAKTLILSSNLPEDLKKWCTRKLES